MPHYLMWLVLDYVSIWPHFRLLLVATPNIIPILYKSWIVWEVSFDNGDSLSLLLQDGTLLKVFSIQGRGDANLEILSEDEREVSITRKLHKGSNLVILGKGQPQKERKSRWDNIKISNWWYWGKSATEISQIIITSSYI